MSEDKVFPGLTFQERVKWWTHDCFGKAIALDKVERNHRFLEEALELVQSLACSKEDAHALVEYVYGRLAGEPYQEVGGVMVTLAALCNAANFDVALCAELELARASSNIEKIRAKQKAKPKVGPLPGPSAGNSCEWLYSSFDPGDGDIVVSWRVGCEPKRSGRRAGNFCPFCGRRITERENTA